MSDSMDGAWAVADHLPPPEDDWGEGALIAEPTTEMKKGAVAPSIAAGKKRFDGILARDSAESVCNVAFRTPRAAVKVNNVVLPAGFPSLVEFWRRAKSERMFKWGLRKWLDVWPDVEWTAPKTGSGFSACVPGRLRRAIVADSIEAPLKKVQVQIVKALVRCGIVRRADGAASKLLRLKINRVRWQKAIARCLFIVRLRRLMLRCRRKAAARSTGRESPSLKRARM